MAQSLKFGSSDPSKVLGAVFGTFGVQYNPEEFERVREDGFTVLGMVPDCRVFIYGAEVTKDIIDVSVNNSIEGNTCDITLTNPRGRYEITKQDLMGKWREDKDILAAYDYTQFNRVTPGLFDNFMDKITSAAFGKKGATAIKQGMNIAKSVNALLGGGGGAPKVRGVTRQMFETKYFSGISKHNGDIVFDYRDPVYVFFKGRFAPLWYFGFAGIISGWDDTDAYEQTYAIKLKCEDVTSLWKRAKLSERGAMFAFSRGEDRNKSTQISSAYAATDRGASFNFSDLIKTAVFSYDFGRFTYNCHESNPGLYNEKTGPETAGGVDFSNTSEYKKKIVALQKEAFIDGGVPTVGASGARYMFTRATGGWGIGVTGSATFGGAKKDLSGSAGKVNTSKNAGLIPISEIKYLLSKTFGKDMPYTLNEAPLGPSVPIYMQFNELEFPKGVLFNGANLKALLDVSVRYWEAEHTIASNLNSDASKIVGTGWKDGKAFGIAGIHPALTYEFINNFNILDGIWQQCYTSKKSIDRVIMTPNDKIRSTVGGMPTEIVGDANKDKVPAGTSFNFFRPRLFVILPRRFSDRYKKQEGGLAVFSNLFKETTTSVYDFLKEKLKGVEYIMYTSPCGDVFVEPELYDFSPLEFSQKIEKKNIITKSIPVKVRTYSGEQNLPATRSDKAYVFNPFANHPFFIMEKDRLRVTQTFNHQLIHTSVSVRGGTTPGGGMTEILDNTAIEMITGVATASQSRGYRMSTAFANGVYIADGFQANYAPDGAVALARTKTDEQAILLNKMVFSELLQQKGGATITQIAIEYYKFMGAMEKDYALYYVFSESANQVQNIIMNAEETAKPNDLALLVLNSMFKTLANFADKKVSEFLKLEYAKGTTTSSKESQTAIKNSNVMNQLKVSSDIYATVSRILGESWYDTKDSSVAAIKELVLLGTPSVVESPVVKPIITKYQTLKQDLDKKGGSDKGVLVRNIAEEKQAAQLGIYDPRTDLVKHYGYNPKGEVKNLFIKNGAEAYDYARTLFNRLKGKAFQITTDIIGRPELMLNRPYYCERKDSIGLLTKFTLKFQVGSSFLSTVALDYVRKNSIGYGYSLGELDVFKGSTNNKYFKSQADLYYKMNRFATNFSSRTTDAIMTSVAGNDPGFGRAVAAKMVGNVASSIMGSVLPVGGVFSMHDRIGHIPFDTRFGETGMSTSNAYIAGITGSNTDSIDVKNNENLYSIAVKIADLIESRRLNTEKKKSYNTAITALNNELNKYSEEALKLNDQIIAEKDNIKIKILTMQMFLLKNKSNIGESQLAALTTNSNTIDTAILNTNLLLYGVKEKPGNLTDALIKTFDAIYTQVSTFSLAKEYSTGLFYQLFVTHVNATKQVAQSDYRAWMVTEEPASKTSFPNLGDIDYYIIRNPSVPKAVLLPAQNTDIIV